MNVEPAALAGLGVGIALWRSRPGLGGLPLFRPGLNKESSRSLEARQQFETAISLKGTVQTSWTRTRSFPLTTGQTWMLAGYPWFWGVEPLGAYVGSR
jgi:hypothetical protein